MNTNIKAVSSVTMLIVGVLVLSVVVTLVTNLFLKPKTTTVIVERNGGGWWGRYGRGLPGWGGARPPPPPSHPNPRRVTPPA